jgi:hypothetical protein
MSIRFGLKLDVTFSGLPHSSSEITVSIFLYSNQLIFLKPAKPVQTV